MGDTDKDTPRHFKAGGPFWLDLSFDDPLPPAAIPTASLIGPIDREPKNSQGLNISGNKSPQPTSADPRKIRITGQIPVNAPPGTYQVNYLANQWAAGSPDTWHSEPIPFSHLGEDLLIVVEPKEGAPPQPRIPNLTDID